MPSACFAPEERTIPHMIVADHLARTIVDHRSYGDWDTAHRAYAEIRRSTPLGRAELDDYDPFWIVSKFDDIQLVERQPAIFRNGDMPVTLLNRTQHRGIRERSGGKPYRIRSLVQMDSPDHMKYRLLTQNWFMPQRLRDLQPRIRQIAKSFVDRLMDIGPECDFARDIAFLYPLRVIMEVMGVPEEDEARMLRLTQELFGSNDPELSRSANAASAAPLSPEDHTAAIDETIQDFFSYFTAIIEDRRAAPRNDLASVIANGSVGGAPIGHLEAISYYIIAATAGHDTTSASTASGAWVLAERPDLLRELKKDASLIDGFVDEVIRWETPVKHFMRSAATDTEIGGQAIGAGDWLMLCYMSGNRDEDRYDAPFEFDVRRPDNKHVAFGYGPHVCLGQHLARMEMRILWEELLPRLETLELTGSPRRMISNFVSGPKTLPIRFSAS